MVKRPSALCSFAAMLVASVLLAGCSQSGGTAATNATGSVGRATSLPPPDVPGTYATQTEYRIGPLDLLDVSVFQVPDLSRTVQVDAAGLMTLPLIGNVPAAGKTVEELQRDVAARLGEKYLESPQVTVFVKESPGRQVTVEGAVNKPGIFPIAGTTTLLQAVALSGGMSDVANAGNVTVFRTVKNQRMAAVFNVKTIRSGKMSDPEIYGGDLIVVGESGARTTFRELGKVAPIVGVFNPLMF
jgi:polysaccharide export outer membrane protein